MIVKVQVSTDGQRKVLVYDEERTVQWEGPLDPDTEVLMGGRAKAFFFARVDEQKRISLGQGAGWQDW